MAKSPKPKIATPAAEPVREKIYTNSTPEMAAWIRDRAKALGYPHNMSSVIDDMLRRARAEIEREIAAAAAGVGRAS